MTRCRSSKCLGSSAVSWLWCGNISFQSGRHGLHSCSIGNPGSVRRGELVAWERIQCDGANCLYVCFSLTDRDGFLTIESGGAAASAARPGLGQRGSFRCWHQHAGHGGGQQWLWGGARAQRDWRLRSWSVPRLPDNNWEDPFEASFRGAGVWHQADHRGGREAGEDEQEHMGQAEQLFLGHCQFTLACFYSVTFSLGPNCNCIPASTKFAFCSTRPQDKPSLAGAV